MSEPLYLVKGARHAPAPELVDEDATTNRVEITADPMPPLWKLLVFGSLLPVVAMLGLAYVLIERWPAPGLEAPPAAEARWP